MNNYNHEPHEPTRTTTRYVLIVRGVRSHCRSPKGDLALLRTAAFVGATLCGINDLHGFTVHLFSGFVVEFLE